MAGIPGNPDNKDFFGEFSKKDEAAGISTGPSWEDFQRFESGQQTQGDDFSFGQQQEPMPQLQQQEHFTPPIRRKPVLNETTRGILKALNPLTEKPNTGTQEPVKPQESLPPIRRGEIPKPQSGDVEKKQEKQGTLGYYGKTPKASDLGPIDYNPMTQEDLTMMFQEAIKANEPSQKSIILDTMSRLDLSPLWNWMDNTFGTNYLKGYKPPGSPSEVLDRMRKAREAGVNEFKTRFLARKGIEDIKVRIIENERQLKNAMNIAVLNADAALDRTRVMASSSIKTAEKQNQREQLAEGVTRDLVDIMNNIYDIVTTDPNVSLNPVGVVKGKIGEYWSGSGWSGDAALQKAFSDMVEALAPERLGSTRTAGEMKSLRTWVGSAFKSRASFKRDYITFATKLNNLYRTFNLDLKSPIPLPFNEDDLAAAREALKEEKNR